MRITTSDVKVKGLQGTSFRDIPKLNDEEYDKLESKKDKILEMTNKKPTQTLKFKDMHPDVPEDYKSEIIVGKLPEGNKAWNDNKRENFKDKEGNEVDAYSVPLVIAGERWTNFITLEKAEYDAYEAHKGCAIIAVGKLTEKKNPKDPENPWLNIKGFRGCLVLEQTDNAVDEDEKDEDYSL